jgi:hypothetical protein
MVTILIPGNHDHQHLKLCRLDALPYAWVSDFFFPSLEQYPSNNWIFLIRLWRHMYKPAVLLNNIYKLNFHLTEKHTFQLQRPIDWCRKSECGRISRICEKAICINKILLCAKFETIRIQKLPFIVYFLKFILCLKVSLRAIIPYNQCTLKCSENAFLQIFISSYG